MFLYIFPVVFMKIDFKRPLLSYFFFEFLFAKLKFSKKESITKNILVKTENNIVETTSLNIKMKTSIDKIKIRQRFFQ